MNNMYADTTYSYKNLNPRKLTTDTNSMDFPGDKQEACTGRSPVCRKRKEYLLFIYFSMLTMVNFIQKCIANFAKV